MRVQPPRDKPAEQSGERPERADAAPGDQPSDPQAAFVAAYRRHLRPVGGFLARRVESQHVEDLAAEVFAIAWRRRDAVTPGEELPWLYGIAGNVVRNHRRSLRRQHDLLAGWRPADSAPSAEELVLADQGLADAWGTLRASEREVLALAVFEALPVAQIATVLGISANAVSIRLHRARQRLAAALDAD